MSESFADRVELLSSKAYFAEVARKVLNSLFGKSLMSVVLYHLGPDALQDPKVFEEKIKAVFGAGAEAILKKVIENLETTTKS
ncbi:hypothetical protein MUP77_24105 [Candidatus Bathyarchaeota archaeon]|nr:hypothetical protein [Candidatus Bathyarchaeota archaeon]